MKGKGYCHDAHDGFDERHDRFKGADVIMRVAALAVVMAALGLTASSGAARAQDFTITIKDHRFEPAELRVPAKKRFTVYVINDDPTPEEFESLPMKVEKVIPGKTKAVVRIGPLDPGRYEFIGEFNQDTAKGVMIAE
jgi:hypothetical protein